MAADEWRGHVEDNPILGTNPTQHVVDSYMAVAAAGLLVASETLSPRVALVVGVLAVGVEVKAIRHNVINHTNMCR